MVGLRPERGAGDVRPGKAVAVRGAGPAAERNVASVPGRRAGCRGYSEFDTVWCWDHLLPVFGSDDSPCFETLTTLGAMAAATTRVRIGVLVNGVLYRDPATLAKAAATVDQITGGRLEFSLGGAWATSRVQSLWAAVPVFGGAL